MSPNVSQKIKIGPKQKVAFVCSGGATKAGAFHLGVALALQEQGFKFFGGCVDSNDPQKKSKKTPKKMDISTYVGSSAGSMIASYLASGYSLENIFNSFLGRQPTAIEDALPKPLPSLTYQKMFKFHPGLAFEQVKQVLKIKQIISDLVKGNWESFIEFRWLTTTGFFTTQGIEQYLREEVLPSNRFQDYLSDLFIVSTQLNHSRKVVFGKQSYNPPQHDFNCQYDNSVSVSQAVAASTALPFIFSPYAIPNSEGHPIYYIDGEIRDTLSTHVAIDAGADLVFASYTHQPYHFLREIGSLTDHGLPAILIQSLYLVIEQKIRYHIRDKEVRKNAISAVEQFCKDEGLSDRHRNRIIEILEAELQHRRGVDTIYIHPNPTDAAMFFGEHFSLSPAKTSEIVKSGFRAAIETLRNYEFADKE